MVRAGRPPRPRAQAAAVAVLLAGSTGLAGCGAGSEQPDLAGRTFTSSEVRGHTLVDGTIIRLSFDEDGISGQAGCNTIFGDASWDDGALVAPGPLAMTMMGCDDGLSAQDQWLADFLASEPSIVLDDDILVLDNDREGITLTEEAS